MFIAVTESADHVPATKGIPMANYLPGDVYDPATTNTDWWLLNAPPDATVQDTSVGRRARGSDQTAAPPAPESTGSVNYDIAGSHAISAAMPAPDQQQLISWGGPVAPFDQTANPYPTFTPPPLPDSLKNPWTLPTAADVQNTPGYQSRYLQGLDARQRAAAGRGTILNGGTQKALDRYGTDYADQAYQSDVTNSLNQRQQASSDYLNLAYGPSWQTNTAAVNQYGQMYKQYADSIANNRTSQNDYWQQQMDLLNAGLKAAGAGSPGSTGGQV